MGAASLFERDQRANARLQKLRFFPSALVGGQGCRVRDESGRSLLDLSASCSSAALGYAHPAQIAAVERAVRDPAGFSVLTSASLPATELAERLLQLTPGQGERRVWIGHSGSDANEAVLRAIRHASGRERVICFRGSYHGGSAATIAISGHKGEISADEASRRVLLPFPQDGDGSAVLDELERRFASDAPAHTIAAAFIEPLQGDGGMLLPPPGFLARFSALCARHGIVVVCDEIKVGMGRSGLLHCFQHEGLQPDVVTLAKGLGGGLPVSAAIGPAALLDVAPAFAMQSLQGNAVSMASALAVLDTIEREGLAANAAAVGAHFQAGLQALAATQPLIGAVRGRGLALGVELVTDRVLRTPATRATAKVVYRAFEKGLLMNYLGMDSNVLEITPPILTRDDADHAVALLGEALDDVAQGRVDDRVLEGFEGW